MTTLQDYAALAFYDQKQNFTGPDFVKGKDIEAWVKDLPYGSNTPTIKTITIDAAVVADAEEIAVTTTSTTAVKLYRRDVLKFMPSEVLVVIAEDVTIATGVTPTTVKILPAVDAIPDSETASTYGMIPILSMAEGGLPEMTGTDAEAMNKEQGLYKARATVSRDGSVSITGALLRNDPSIRLLQDIGLGSRPVYYQARYPAFELLDNGGYSEGSGPGAYEVVMTLTNNSYPSGGQEFVQVNYTLNFSGKPIIYTPLVVIP